MLIQQMLTCLEFVHKKHFIHRDIKPDNFMLGIKERKNQVYLIDFGLAKRFEDPRTRKHLEYAEGKSLTGTARYASINAMSGIEQSRRDDLESLGYVWIYMLKGKLPWQGIPARTQKEKMDRILEVKKNCTIAALCERLPTEFIHYFQMVRRLGFNEEPEYAEYREMFRELFVREKFVYNYKYDWGDSFNVLPSADRSSLTSDRSPVVATEPVSVNRDGDPGPSFEKLRLEHDRSMGVLLGKQHRAPQGPIERQLAHGPHVRDRRLPTRPAPRAPLGLGDARAKIVQTTLVAPASPGLRGERRTASKPLVRKPVLAWVEVR
jgi:serine/threonine protein kinase